MVHFPWRRALARGGPVAVAALASSTALAVGEVSGWEGAYSWLGFTFAVALGVAFPHRDTRPLVAAYLVPPFVLGYLEMPEALAVLIIATPLGAVVTWFAVSIGQRLRRQIGETREAGGQDVPATGVQEVSAAMPDELSDVIPVVPYEDIRAGHDFLVDVLGFTSHGLEEDGDGHVVHGEVRAGDRRIWLHAASGGLTTPQRTGTASGGIVVHVADVDAHYEHAKSRGATILREPTDQDYGQREYGVRDPEGHSWYIATPFSSPAG